MCLSLNLPARMQMLPTGCGCPSSSGTQVSKEDCHQAAGPALYCKDLTVFPYLQVEHPQISSITKQSHSPHSHSSQVVLTPRNLCHSCLNSWSAMSVATFNLRPKASMRHLSLQLQKHAVVGLQAHAGSEHILQHCSLLAKGIDDWGALGHDRCLFHNICMSTAVI